MTKQKNAKSPLLIALLLYAQHRELTREPFNREKACMT